MKKSILLILVVFFFLTTFLCLSANSTVTYEDFLVMRQQAQVSLETNNPDGHSEIFTETEITPESIQLSYGWIEGIGIWGIKGFNWFEQGVVPAIGNGYYDEDGIYIPTTVKPSSPGDNYTYYQITMPDTANIPPGMIFPSIGLYIPDN